ncbi:hypothetical protein B0H66DRAFT_274517 [Apodospora peruviana]|uniref:C2H2-type domain-containing protein n=1 Tax=Apodospora peruviana TaxID=516989 RepID=A0AAE0HZX0_9PEZI|nr:hypothetical protein B0H66DRAFT_274517 [Apodospora peruviana]
MAAITRTETIEITEDDASTVDPFTRTTEEIFRAALDDFKLTLTEAQRDTFPGKGLSHVKCKIMSIQHHQERLKAMMNFSRIQFYLERFAEFDAVCQCTKIGGDESAELSAYIWGPSTYILQVSQEDHTVLDVVLDAYQKFGKRIPDLQVYSSMIKERANMMKCVAFMYHDLLQFYRNLVKLLTGRGWKKTFHANWRDYGQSFEALLESFDAHGEVLKKLLAAWKKQASDDNNQRLNDHILQYQDDRQITHGHAAQYQQDRDALVEGAQASQDMHRQLNDHILQSNDNHRELQRHIAQYEEDRLERLRVAKVEEKKRKMDQRADVLQWMSTPGASQREYHETAKNARSEFPDTGMWVLTEDKIFDWMNAETPTKSMVWMNGKKGAGKTVLSSLIIENCEMKPDFKTSYFYCREDDTNQNTCVSVLKGILRQMVSHNEDLLPSCYEKRGRGEERLHDLATIKSLLDLFCEYDMNQFIVIDGLDECIAAEIKPLVQYWASVVDKCDNYKPGKIRVLLVGQDISDIRKLACMQSADIFELHPTQSGRDIHKYLDVQFEKLQKEYDLTEDEARMAQELICSKAEGMFLYAVLTVENLLAQATTGDVKAEIRADRLPSSLEAAYKKIIDRLQRNPGERQWAMAKKIFGWLARAKRPLQWHELQAALSIQPDHRPGEDPIDFHNNQLRKDIREICGSLVQVLEDRIEFIHSTTRSHIVKSEHLDARVIETDLTLICLKYLTLPCFDSNITSDDLEHYATIGWYAFQDYAISKWKHHLESMITIALPLFQDPNSGPLYEEKFCAVLTGFLDFHKASIAAAAQEKTQTKSGRTIVLVPASASTPPLLSPPASQQSLTDSRSSTPLSAQTQPGQLYPQQQGTIDPALFCQKFQQTRFYPQLVQLWTHVCKHQTSDFKERNKVSLLHLDAFLGKIRTTLQTLATSPTKMDVKSLRKLYGTRFYKCHRVTCDYFHEGYDSKSALDKHSNRHDRPFQCPFSCSLVPFGFSSNKDRERHIRQYHPDEADGPSQFVAATEAKKTVAEAKWPCDLCGKKFTRLTIKKAHVDSHYGTRRHACEACGKMFTRSYDRNRHRKIHTRRAGGGR